MHKHEEIIYSFTNMLFLKALVFVAYLKFLLKQKLSTMGQ